MSRADHPAGRALQPGGTLTCASLHCTARPVARVTAFSGSALVRPATAGPEYGPLLCLDCAHHAVDTMLLRATPEPTP